MKKIIIPFICILFIGATFYYIEPLTDLITSFISRTPEIVIKDANIYAKNNSYLYIQKTDDFIPYSNQDLLNIFYSTLDNGWKQFTFYCPKEYENCIRDIQILSDPDNLTLSHINNYVHPFNSFYNFQTIYSDSGEVTLKINYLYSKEEIDAINTKVDELINTLIKDNMDDNTKIKTIHDYLINNSKYDTQKEKTGTSNYKSDKAYGPLFQGYATCSGYTDLMAIFLTKLGFNNYRIATTEDRITYSDQGHVWNAVYYNNNWLHLDLTWDDPVSSDNKDYLFYTYFLKTTAEMAEADEGKTVVEDHNFDKLYYLEFND